MDFAAMDQPPQNATGQYNIPPPGQPGMGMPPAGGMPPGQPGMGMPPAGGMGMPPAGGMGMPPPDMGMGMGGPPAYQPNMYQGPDASNVMP